MTVRFLKQNGRPRHKFGAFPCERDGKKFPSKLQARYYDKLLMLQSSGQVLFFLRQIPFVLPGSVRYVLTFRCSIPKLEQITVSEAINVWLYTLSPKTRINYQSGLRLLAELGLLPSYKFTGLCYCKP